MKIEAGKYYKDKEGNKIFIATRNPFKNQDKYYWLGFFERFDHLQYPPNSAGWEIDGLYKANDNHTLIAEWQEETPKPELPEKICSVDMEIQGLAGTERFLATQINKIIDYLAAQQKENK